MASTITTISLPPSLRKRLDREAARQRRSRSFVVAEAIERYLAEADRRGFEEGRKRTLREALALSPAERVRLAEELWASSRGAAGEWSRGRRRSTPSRSTSCGVAVAAPRPDDQTLEDLRRLR